jgi:hypothetical protein
MKYLNLQSGLVALAIASVLAGCGGLSGFAPTAGPAGIDTARASAPTQQQLVPDANPKGTCTAPIYKVPGTYVGLVAFGNVAAGTFTSQTGLWVQSVYKPGTMPTPSAIPSAKPGPPEFVYVGTYAMKKSKITGCAVLLTTQNGKPFKHSTQNAFGVGSPLVKAKGLSISPVTTGNLTMTITGLSASGGKGSAILTTSAGAPYDTATITLTARYTQK